MSIKIQISHSIRVLVVYMLAGAACSRAPESTSKIKTKTNAVDFEFSEGGSSLQDGNVCQSGVDAFKTTLHPWLRTHCAACHSPEGSGPAHGPAHSVPDVETSYQMISKYLNPSQLDTSRLVVKGGNMHCLSDYGLDCKTTSADLLPLVQAWWNQGENRCPHALPIQSRELNIPNPLPIKGSGFAAVRLKMEEINPDYKDLFFEFEIQRSAAAEDGHPGSYLIQRPRFLSRAGSWRVRGIKFALNGYVQVGADMFSSVDTAVMAIDNVAFEDPIWPERVASVKAGIMIEQSAATDKIRVSFGEITKTSAKAECHDLEMFFSDVKPMIAVLGCQYCHGGDPRRPEGDALAIARMTMRGDDAALCQQFARHGQRTTPDLSPVIWFPMHGRPVHPLVISSSDVVMPAWTHWLEKGI